MKIRKRKLMEVKFKERGREGKENKQDWKERKVKMRNKINKGKVRERKLIIMKVKKRK